MLKNRKDTLGQITKNTQNGSWREATNKISDAVGINMEDRVGTKYTNKRKTN